jgi:DNA polymerase III subunit alpha
VTDKSFVHLHTHTEFSMLDGAAKIDDVMQAAAADGQPAVGITDHGVLYGVVDFYRAAQPGGRQAGHRYRGLHHSRQPVRPAPAQPERAASHAAVRPGRHRLPQPHAAVVEGIPGGVLLQAADGQGAAGGACFGAHRHLRLPGRGGPQLLAPDGWKEEGNQGAVRDFDAALEAAATYQDIFGKGNYFIEVQDHGIESQQRILPDLVEIAKRIGAPLFATNDLHYTYARSTRPTTCCCASRPAPPSTSRTGSSSTATSSS